MKEVTPYDFSGSQDKIIGYQKKFLKFFKQCKKVLDIGSGEGIFLKLLREKGIEGVGVDSYLPAVEACRKNGFTVYNEDALSFLANTKEKFDGIFCSHLIEHLKYEEFLKFIDLARNVLAEKGTIVLVTPNSESLWVVLRIFWLDPTHVRMYPGKLLSSVLKAHGFDVVRVSSTYNFSLGSIAQTIMDSIAAFKFTRINLFVVAKRA